MRLLAHSFKLPRGDEMRIAVFYALSRQSARALADQWAARRGWRVIS
jgi:hypothetical protein